MTAGDGDGAPGGEALTGDGVTPGIVRIGDTVRRPVRPFTATIQAYLAHLQQAGFTAAPVPLGIDEQGREVLSYVPGDVPREPLPPETARDDVLVALARLIRRLHEASAGWTPPADAVWFGLPGSGTVAAAAPPPPDGEPELVSHRDYCPGNVVFRDGLPAALIDFDLAKPTTRLYDVVNALWWWAPLRDPRDLAPAFAGADIPRRAAVFADAYGMTEQQRQQTVPLAIWVARRYHQTARAAAEADPVFRRLWDQGAKDELPRAVAWLERAGPAIAAALTGTPAGQDTAGR
jgi:aminoglycoside phosphotransferase (APT) family kinase protein